MEGKDSAEGKYASSPSPSSSSPVPPHPPHPTLCFDEGKQQPLSGSSSSPGTGGCSAGKRRLLDAQHLDMSLSIGRVHQSEGERRGSELSVGGGSPLDDVGLAGGRRAWGADVDAAAIAAADPGSPSPRAPPQQADDEALREMDRTIQEIGDWQGTRQAGIRKLRAELAAADEAEALAAAAAAAASGRGSGRLGEETGDGVDDEDDLAERVLQSELRRLQLRRAELESKTRSTVLNPRMPTTRHVQLAPSKLEELKRQAATDAGADALENVRRGLQRLRADEYGEQLAETVRTRVAEAAEAADAAEAAEAAEAVEMAAGNGDASERSKHGAGSGGGGGGAGDGSKVCGASVGASGGAGSSADAAECAELKDKLDCFSTDLDDVMR